MAGAASWDTPPSTGTASPAPVARTAACRPTRASKRSCATSRRLPAPHRRAAIAARADAGTPGTLAMLDIAGTALGIALADMLNILDMDTVLLGGSFSLLSSWLTTNARAEIDQRVLTAAWAPVTVRAALLSLDAAVIGAALTSTDQVRQDPTPWLASET
ncbi:ROK family protein [Micromonospora matsumotoense]|uniref:ROK family protein n=1 Tax=Micromonospora matsumotoense TaxID=121616 RepID=UPI003D93CFD5